MAEEYEMMMAKFESLERFRLQIDRLAAFISAEVPGEPSRVESSVDCAIRIIRQHQRPERPLLVTPNGGR